MDSPALCRHLCHLHVHPGHLPVLPQESPQVSFQFFISCLCLIRLPVVSLHVSCHHSSTSLCLSRNDLLGLEGRMVNMSPDETISGKPLNGSAAGEKTDRFTAIGDQVDHHHHHENEKRLSFVYRFLHNRTPA